ncbi:MAG: Cell division protein ZapC [Candidatus Erwinia impunctatus]|nr:Cell division protein ZapC [Culicoides impunctatus]
MKTAPDDNWFWNFDAELNCMTLERKHSAPFCSPYPKKMLTPEALNRTAFTVDDIEQFTVIEAWCRHCFENDELEERLILNALIAWRFLKPLMPKSWHFISARDGGYAPECGEFVEVTLLDSGEPALLLVIEAGNSAAQCLVAQPELTLGDKTMVLGEAIKVMNDRLQKKQPHQVVFSCAV